MWFKSWEKQGEARRPELRVEASRPVGQRGGGVLEEGVPPVGSGAKPRRPRDFCGFWYSVSHSS